MKKYVLLLALVSILFVSCEKESDIKEQPIDKEKFVGLYQLTMSGHLDVFINNEIQPNVMDVNENNYSFKLKLNDSLDNKLSVSDCAYHNPSFVMLYDSIVPLSPICPYFGNLSATIKDDGLYFDVLYEKYSTISGQHDTTTCTKTIVFDKAKLDGNKLYWTGKVTEVVTSTVPLQQTSIIGELYYTAIRE